MRNRNSLKLKSYNIHGLINEKDYNIIRQGLLSKDKRIIKSSIQRIISEYEQNKNLIRYCKDDLCAILFDLVQDNDSNLRKWVYHLIAYVHDDNLINRCILNLSEEIENDKENITWILAIASCNTTNNTLLHIYNKYAKDRYVSKRLFNLCSSVFSNQINNLTKREIQKIIDSDDFLSKMWLTKIYACHYDFEKYNLYSNFVNDNIMNSLIDDYRSRRYALWAFSTRENVNLNRIKVKPYCAFDLDVKSQAWYFNCMFKDKEYVFKHKDHILSIMSTFKNLQSPVQFGILRGIEMSNCKLNYLSGEILFLYNELDENNIEDSLIQIQLIKILIKHAQESSEIDDFLNSIKRTTHNLEIYRCLLKYNTIREEYIMSRTVNVYGGQYIEKSNSVTQNNDIAHEKAIQICKASAKEISEISDEINSGMYDKIILNSLSMANMITKIEYELNQVKINQSDMSSEESKNILNLERALFELRKSDDKDRRINFSSFLTKLSQICSITTATPKIINLLEPIITHIKAFLGL